MSRGRGGATYTNLVTSNSLHPAFTTTRASTATVRDSSGQIVSVAANLPRFDHDANGNPLGLLVEESRSNHLHDSDEPVTQTRTLSTGTYTLWCEGSGSVEVAANTAVGSGFGTATAGSPVVFTITTGGTVDYTVPGVQPDIFQSELGSFSTSFIFTAGSAVTRSADDIVCTDLGRIGFSQTQNSVYFRATSAPVSTGTDTLIVFNDESTNERINVRRNIGNFQLLVVDGGVTQALITDAWASSTERKGAAAWAANDFVAYTDGTQAGTDAAGALPTPTHAQLGRELGGSYYNGRIAELRLFGGQRLPNAQLQSMTA